VSKRILKGAIFNLVRDLNQIDCHAVKDEINPLKAKRSFCVAISKLSLVQ
jgi:hypothetical protein